MVDIVERLRYQKEYWPPDDWNLFIDASIEIERLRSALERVSVGINHIATYRTDSWPDYKLDGLTREQQCESALRTLGAGKDFDMWCCWSAAMQVRDDLASAQEG